MHREAIEKYIEDNRNLLLEKTKMLVEIPSFKGEAKPGMPFGEGPDKALHAALTLGEEFGFTTTNYDGYVGTIDFSDAPAQLDILAHLDVVPAPPEEWTVTEPFVPLEKDGKLYGRGASDDKGPAVAALLAMKAVKDLGIPLKKNVRLVLGTDEESGGEDIDYYYAKEKVAPMTFSPDASFPVINVEKGRFAGTITASYPTSDSPRVHSIKCGAAINVVPDQASMVVEGLEESEIQKVADTWAEELGLKYKTSADPNGILVEIKGVGGHAAEPELSNNAATAIIELATRLPLAKSEAADKLKALSELFPHNDWLGEAVGVKMKDDIAGDLTISLNIIELDESGFDARFDSRTALVATSENTVDVVKANTEKKGLELSEHTTNSAHHVPEDSDFVQTLLKVYEEYSGNKGECLAIGGGTYVHGLENAVAFGATLPGTSGNIHGADEYAVIDELILSAKIFTQVIIELCS